jgi:hypothetical protein
VGAEDAEERAEIVRETRRRLRKLELQKARKGDDAEPHIDIEIARLNKELGYSEVLAHSAVEPEYAQKIGPDNQFVLLAHLVDGVNASIGLVGKRVDDAKEAFEQRVDAVQDYLDQRITSVEVGDTEHRERERTERIAGQRGIKKLIISVGIVFTFLILAIALVLFMVVQQIMQLRGLGR